MNEACDRDALTTEWLQQLPGHPQRCSGISAGVAATRKIVDGDGNFAPAVRCGPKCNGEKNKTHVVVRLIVGQRLALRHAVPGELCDAEEHRSRNTTRRSV